MARHSPLAEKIRRSQSGTKSLSLSVHVRLTERTDVVNGFTASVSVVAVLLVSLPTDSFSAVRPSPNRSYTPPSRGLRSAHDGTLATPRSCALFLTDPRPPAGLSPPR